MGWDNEMGGEWSNLESKVFIRHFQLLRVLQVLNIEYIMLPKIFCHQTITVNAGLHQTVATNLKASNCIETFCSF